MLATEFINIIQTWEFNNTSELLLKYLKIYSHTKDSSHASQSSYNYTSQNTKA